MVETASNLIRSCILCVVFLTIGTLMADEKLAGLMTEGKYAKAVEYIDQIPVPQRTVDVWLDYAESLDKTTTDKQKVLNAFTEAQKVQPSDPKIFAAMGDFYTRQKDYSNAIKPYQKWYLLERSAKAAEAMATCAMRLKLYEKARDAAESAVKLDSVNTLESRKILSALYLTDKDWVSAAQQLEAIVLKIKDDVGYWKKLAHCYEETNNREKIITAAARIVDLDKKDIPSRRRMVDYYLEKKESASAFTLLKELAVLTPEDAKIFKYLYQISLEKDQKKDAVLYLRNFLMLDSSDASAYKVQGDLLYEQKNFGEAIDAYRKAIKLNPSITGLYKAFIAIAIEKKLDDEIIAIAPKAIAAGEMDAATYATIGNIYKRKGRCNDAIIYYQNALKADLKNLTVISALAECQTSLGKINDALLNYQQVVLLNPNANIEYKQLGDLMISQNKTEEAMDNYIKYLEKTPSDEQIASKVGLYLHSRKQYKEALPYLEKIKEPKLVTSSFIIKLADCYYQTGNFQKAVESFSKARSQNANHAATLQEILKPLAVSYEKIGFLAEAAKTYEAYVKLPGVKDPDASYKQAALRESADRAGAIALYQSNTVVFPQDARNFIRLGILLSEDPEQTAKAIEMLQKASVLAPNDTVVWQKLSDAYHATNNSAKELTASQKLAGFQPNNITANQRAGTILYKKKQYAQAVPYLQKVISVTPRDVEALLMLADALMQTKEPAKAVELYVKAKELQPENVKICLALITSAEAAGQMEKVTETKNGLAELDKKIMSKDPKSVDSRMRLAEYLMAKNEYDAAFPIYKELAVLTPKDKQVFSRLVELSQKKGKDNEALTYLKQYVALDAANAKAHLTLGNMYFDQKNFDGALVEYRTAWKLDPALNGFLQHYGEIVVQKNLVDEAITVLNAAIKNNESDPKMYITIGKLYQKKQQYPQAIAMYKKASNNDPKNMEVLTLLAECQAANNDVSNSIITYEQVVLLNPQADMEYKALGELQMKQNKNEDAIKSFRKYLEKATGDDKISRIVGMNLYGKKQYQEAVRYLEMVKNPSLLNEEYLLALGDSYYQLQNCQKACIIFNQLRLKKTSETILKKILRPLAECYEKSNDPVKASEVYEAYTALPGVSDADASYLRAFLREKSDPKAAEVLYISNMKSFPKDGRSFLRLGILYSENPGTVSKAAEPLSQASQLSPKDAAILIKLAQVYNALKNEDRELETYKKLLQQDPQNLEANRRVGAILIKKKQYSKAIENLEIVQLTNPQDAEIMLMLSEGYLKTNRKDKGIELLAKAQTIKKDNPDLLLQLYTVYKEVGKLSEAENTIKQLIALKKDNKFRAMYANDLINQKRYDESKTVADEIVKSDPMNIDGLMLVGKIQKMQNKFEEALETFKMVLYVNENYAPANYERGEIYRKQSQNDRAESYYQKALQTDPKYALAELGLARIAKIKNKVSDYTSHFNKAKLLDPEDKEIIAELKETAKQ